MSSRGNRNEDLTVVRAVRTAAPKVQILLIGVTGEEAEFMCMRAGVRGYLPWDASTDDVVEGIRALQEGKSVQESMLAVEPCSARLQAVEKSRRSALLRAQGPALLRRS